MEGINKTSTMTIKDLVRFLSSPIPCLSLLPGRYRVLQFISSPLFQPPCLVPHLRLFPTSSSPFLFHHPLSSTTRQFDTYDPSLIHSTPGVRTDLFPRPLDQVLLTDFFGGVASVDVSSPPSCAPVLPPSSYAEESAVPPLVVREGLGLGQARKKKEQVEGEERMREMKERGERWQSWKAAGKGKVDGEEDKARWWIGLGNWMLGGKADKWQVGIELLAFGVAWTVLFS
jgi:hypothetical protein